MGNLKTLKRRIKSAKNIRKITKTMKMVAVAKVQRLKRMEENSRRFIGEFEQLINLVNENLLNDGNLERYPLMLPSKTVKRIYCIVITSDRGLCGSYNSNLLREFVQYYQEQTTAGKEVIVTVIGKKGGTTLPRMGIKLDKCLMNLPAVPTVSLANSLKDDAIERFVGNKVDEVVIFHNEFVSMIRYNRKLLNLLPITLPETRLSRADKNSYQKDVIYAPDQLSILNKMLPFYLQHQIFQCLLSAGASEQAARMVSMSNATDSASEMIQQLTLDFNKERQAAITNEILEVVGGAKALAKGK